LVSRLSTTLEAEGLQYCHWKSNEGLARKPSPEVDFDLLVGRMQAQRFSEILLRLGFKEARSPSARQIPGVLDYYGLDERSGSLVHVHAHHRLVLGDDTTKNYRLPIEAPYLASAVPGPLFRVPSPDFEFVVFVIRMMLKHSAWDAIVTLQGSLSPRERRELTYLTREVDGHHVQSILNEHMPFIDPALFDRSVRSLQESCPLWFRIRAAHQLHRSLVAHARRPQTIDTYLKLWRRGHDRFRRYILHSAPRKRLVTGGALVAVVGGDGAGKSSTVEALHVWLSRHFVVTKIHLGKPPPSAARTLIKSAMAIGRRVGRSSPVRPHLHMIPGNEPQGASRYTWLIRHVVTGRDRYRAYVRARNLAARGGIVVCDRYPLPRVQSMDGSATAWASRSGLGRFGNFLAQRERSYYERIEEPDILIVLKVHPEIAVQRKREEEPTFVRLRSSEVWHLDWTGSGALVVDADLPETEVVSQVKVHVWSRL